MHIMIAEPASIEPLIFAFGDKDEAIGSLEINYLNLYLPPALNSATLFKG
jgi:hypothetical protein